MGWFIFGVLIILLNLCYVIRHYQKSEVTFRAAFSCFALGAMLPTIISQASVLIKLL